MYEKNHTCTLGGGNASARWEHLWELTPESQIWIPQGLSPWRGLPRSGSRFSDFQSQLQRTQQQADQIPPGETKASEVRLLNGLLLSLDGHQWECRMKDPMEMYRPAKPGHSSQLESVWRQLLEIRPFLHKEAALGKKPVGRQSPPKGVRPPQWPRPLQGARNLLGPHLQYRPGSPWNTWPPRGTRLRANPNLMASFNRNYLPSVSVASHLGVWDLAFNLQRNKLSVHSSKLLYIFAYKILC